MIKTVWFWLKNSRIFSLPMTIMSWLIISVYALNEGGSIVNGVLALIAISCCQLATNLFDDYADYKNSPELTQQCKCEYIKNGEATLNDVLKVVIIYCSIAFIIGAILAFKAGFAVVWLAILGGSFVLSYSKLSKIGLSELAVGITFGPLLFEGVYYVMTQNFSFEVFILSFAVVMFTIGLMYVHTVLDFEGDVVSHKKTLCSRLGDKKKAINGVWVVYGLGYLFTIVYIFISKNYLFFLTFLLIPLIFNLYKSLWSFKCGEDVKEFYFRLLKARNLMVYYSLIAVFALWC